MGIAGKLFSNMRESWMAEDHPPWHFGVIQPAFSPIFLYRINQRIRLMLDSSKKHWRVLSTLWGRSMKFLRIFQFLLIVGKATSSAIIIPKDVWEVYHRHETEKKAVLTKFKESYERTNDGEEEYIHPFEKLDCRENLSNKAENHQEI